jgi:prepilin-type N-terminal cleavage/methylation domain-containing protein
MPQRSSTHRPGFTLVELLVAITVLAILVGLLLPAAMRVREASLRSSCQNNLRQVGMAMQQYVGVRGAFPPLWAYSDYWSNGQPSGSLSNWTPYLLPYLDQTDLANTYNLNIMFYQNTGAIARPLKVLQCPSSPRPVELVTEIDWNPSTVAGISSLAVLNPYFTASFEAAPTDYTGFSKISDDWKDLLGYPSGSPDLTPVLSTPPFPTPGELAAFLAGGSISLRAAYRKPADITDGLSNSIVLIEDAGRPQLWENGSLVNAAPTVHYSGWADPGGEFGILQGDTLNGTLINVTNNRGIYSFHPAGANFPLADGSVRFLGVGISAQTLVALLTCSAGDEPKTDD